MLVASSFFHQKLVNNTILHAKSIAAGNVKLSVKQRY